MGVDQIQAKVDRVEMNKGYVLGGVLVLTVELPNFLPQQGNVGG